MKKKKSLLSLGILALVLVLGVGYAVVSTVTLSFGGTAKGVEQADLKVEIGNVISPAPSENVGWSGDEKAINLTVKDMKLNETVTFVIEVLNKETDIDAGLEEKNALTNSNSEYFNVQYSFADTTIPANGSTTVTVTVKMIKTPVVDENNQATFGFSLIAVPKNNADQNN